MDTPKRIYAWSVPPTAHLVGTWCVTSYPDAAQEYILTAEHDRIVAEKDAEIARLLDAMKDATAHLVGAESAYRKYAKRQKDILPKAEADPFFTTRVEDFRKAVNRARAALENRDADT